MKLSQQKKVNILKLSPSTVSAGKEGLIGFPSLPSLIDQTGKTYLSPLGIALYFSELTNTKGFLVGETPDDIINVIKNETLHV